MVVKSKEKQWIVREPGNPIYTRQLVQDLGIDEVLANLLVQRGIKNSDEVRQFFHPSLASLHDPFLMKDMDVAVDRVHKAVLSKEKILVYGDYDVDGTSAVSLVFSFLRRLTGNIDYYIPDRYDEGYGISFYGVDWAAERKCSLVIALDCGIKEAEAVRYAKSKGIDFIICDHHLPGEELPPAVATLDPKREDCHYPYDDLSGCGVGFKLVQAYAQKYGIPFEAIEPLLDLVAVSIAADLVSVTGENRVLAYYGLKRLNESPRKGLLSMIKLSGLEKHKITIDDVVFKIGPRINAAGRMESGRMAVDLLTSEDINEANHIAKQINDHNNERKSIDRTITQQAIEIVRNHPQFSTLNSTVVYNPEWHKGVVGIVASRLVEAFYRPTIVLTKSSNGFISGSARSIAGFDLYDAIESCADLLENFGGHTYAAGLTLKEENLETFRQRFEEIVTKNITKEILTPIINIDAFLEFRQITPRFFRLLNMFQPFGPGNQSPVFMTTSVYDNGNGRIVGNPVDGRGGHLKLELIQEADSFRPLSAIAFNMSEYFDHLAAGEPVDICYSIAENFYRSSIANIQLRIKDIREGKDTTL
jgi:single-stranded-DNA-specific exonuclease